MHVYSFFRMNKQAAIIGASGYAGAELLRYLLPHPAIDVVWATGNRNAGKAVADLYGHLDTDLVLQPMDAATVPDVDVAFLALPHGAGAPVSKALADRGVKIVDLGPDWRLHDASGYDRWYGAPHSYPGELSSWVYGLTELHRADIASSSRVANPGCYSTAAILALAPAIHAGVVEGAGIIIDAASGISGAGRKVAEQFIFAEYDSSYAAYKVGGHRHTPEIEQELGGITVTLTPHYVPMTRGLLVTCYARMRGSVDDVRDALTTAYKGETFVRVLPSGQPGTKQVAASNNALIGIASDERTGLAIITCAIDNLGKGAAGQAIQNANLMLGLDEATGLGAPAVYP
jgi:N-acetyl-gamma-glutamyl-phosphate reductase